LNQYFTSPELNLLLRLLLSHLTADFLLQTNYLVKNKQSGFRSSSFWIHIAIVLSVTSVFLWQLSLMWMPLVIGTMHLIIDIGKIKVGKLLAGKKKNFDLALFIYDQLLHIVTLIIIWLYYIDGWQKFSDNVLATVLDNRWLLRILGYIIVIGPVRFIIRFLVRKWEPDIENTNDGLKNAGMIIGILERTLVLTFVFISQFAAIGFLVAAKSILRLIDKPDAATSYSSRKHTEYVLIGTFLSFGAALLTGLIINWFLHIR
jgi:hypothetical protein